MTPEQDRLLSSYLTGEIDAAQLRELDQLLRTHPEAAARLLALSRVDQMLFERSGPMPDLDSEESAAPDFERSPQRGVRPSRSSPGKVVQTLPRNGPIRAAAKPREKLPARRLMRALPAIAVLCAAACVLFLWRSQQTKPIAILDDVRGEVRAFAHGDSVGIPVSRDFELHSGDRLETGTGGECRVRFAGESTAIGLAEWTTIAFEVRAHGKNLQFYRGEFAADVAKQTTGPMTIRSIHAVATVLGTKFTMAESDARTAIQVTEGAVDFSDPQRGAAVQVANRRLAVAGADLPLQLVPADAAKSPEQLVRQKDVLHGRRLVHDWAFEGNTRDSAGNLRATEFGVAYTGGYRGKALDLSNSGGFTTDRMALPERCEIEFWSFLPPGELTQETGLSKRTIICNSPSGYPDDGFRLMAYEDANDPGSLLLETGDGEHGSGCRSNAGSFLPGHWNHVVVRMDRISGRVRFVVNGSDQTHGSNELHREFRSLAPLTIGMMENGSYRLKGLLDELRITALDQDSPN